VRGWLLQGTSRQAVFFDLPADAVVPEHAHEAQWGIVIEGVLDLTIAGVRRTYRKGDTYAIPEEGSTRPAAPKELSSLTSSPTPGATK